MTTDQELATLRTALEWYADTKNYETENGAPISEAKIDSGRMARAALAGDWELRREEPGGNGRENMQAIPLPERVKRLEDWVVSVLEAHEAGVPGPRPWLREGGPL